MDTDPLLGPRPETTQADIDYIREVTTPVGSQRKGKILYISPAAKTGRLLEDCANYTFTFSRDFISSRIFDILKTDDRVSFYENGHGYAIDIHLLL